MGFPAVQPISPELVLVCPELREQALRLLPVPDPDELFEVGPTPPPTPVRRPRLVLVEEPPRSALPIALAAYVTEALVLGALRGTLFVAAIAAVAFLFAW